VASAQADSDENKRLIGATEVVRVSTVSSPRDSGFLCHSTQDSAALRPGLSCTRLPRSGFSSLQLHGLEESSFSGLEESWFSLLKLEPETDFETCNSKLETGFET
jgi:hypothetical protein